MAVCVMMDTTRTKCQPERCREQTTALHAPENPNTLLAEDEWIRNFLDRVLDSLPLSCKQILKMFYWEGLPMDMIAPTMGLKNANSAKTTKNRCMDKFKKIAT